MEINLVPTLLGSGERMFEGIGDDLRGLELARNRRDAEGDASRIRKALSASDGAACEVAGGDRDLLPGR